jgi:DNA-binding response OmpR family regulator
VVFGGDVQLINSLERMLLFAGANVQAATTGFKGISYTLNLRPDIVIFDDTVSDMDPEKVIEALQADELTKNIPIIVISSRAEAEPYKHLFATGVQDYIRHSEFDVMQIVLRFEAVLHKSTKSSEKPVFDFTESDKNITKTAPSHELRLLVVEDDPLLRNLLTFRLQKSAINHQFCNSGTKAVAAVIEYKPMLPGKNGMDVLAEIRTIPEIAATPVIIFSNKDDDAERSRAAALGVKDFIVKATTDLCDLITLIIARGK